MSAAGSRDGSAPAGRGLLDQRHLLEWRGLLGRRHLLEWRGLLGRRGLFGRWGGERGAGSALALGLTTAVLMLALMIVGAGTAAIAQARAAAAADAAALAAADALSGFVDGSPCALAQAVATASGAHLAACRIEGLDARVTAAVPVGPLIASVTVRAGPPR